MWPFSGAARNELGQSHTMCARVDVLHAGHPVYSLSPTAGSVQAEAGRSVMRNLSVTLADPTGSLSGGDVEDLLSPYECELAPYRGVMVGGVPVWAPLGIFRPTSREAAGDGQVQVTGQDRAIAYQGPMAGGLAISGGTPVETAIARLLVTRHPGVALQSWATGCTVGPLLYKPDINVWDEVQKLAQSVGGWVFHDRTGQPVFSPLLPSSLLPVARWGEGGGLLLSVSRSEDSDSIHNVVVVRNSDGTVTATAEDTDPASPTYVGSSERRVQVITNEHVSSVQQAQQAAATELVRELGRTETAQATIVPDPTLDPLDAATVHRPRVGLVERTLIVQSTEVPLTPGTPENPNPMTVGFRSYILTRDGATLPTTLEVTS